MTEDESRKPSKRKENLIVVILLSAFVGIVIGLMRERGLYSTALLYIGVPTILALAIARTSAAKSVIGSTLKAITFVILISGPLLQEGFVCMVMAAPILYIVGGLVAWPFDHYRKKREREQSSSSAKLYILPSLLLLMSIEGVFEETSFDRHNVVEHTQIVDGRVTEVKRKLGANRPIEDPESLFGQLFPRPDTLYANGLAIGDVHWVDTSYFKWIYWNEVRGTIRFEVTEHRPTEIKFKPVSDSSYLSNYLTWGDTTVIFEPLADNRTQVTWRIGFQRNIDPAWYAQPLERYAVGIAAEMLVATLQ